MTRIEDRVIAILKNPASARQIKYLALYLLEHQFNVARLTSLARENQVDDKLGFLSEISSVATRKSGFSDYVKLNALNKTLWRKKHNWSYLEPTLPDYAKRIIAASPQSKYNKRWKIYSTLNPEEIQDWIKLYGLNQNVKQLSRQGTY